MVDFRVTHGDVVNQRSSQADGVYQHFDGAVLFDRVGQDGGADGDVVLGSFQTQDLDLAQVDTAGAGDLTLRGEPVLDGLDGVDQNFAGNTAAHGCAQQAVDVEQTDIQRATATIAAGLAGARSFATGLFSASVAGVESFVVVYSHGVTPWGFEMLLGPRTS
ncbi:hypothetical protein D3C78_676760 [compost metagenome]